MARTRRRKTWIAAVAVLIALWLWLAGPARVDPNAEGALPAPPRADPESAPSPVADPAPKARTDEPSTAPNTARSTASTTEPSTAPTPTPSAAAADRFGVARFGVDDAIRTGRVALAWRLVDELAAATSEPPLKAAVAKRVAELDAETDAWFTELRRELAAGEVRRARRPVRRSFRRRMHGARLAAAARRRGRGCAAVATEPGAADERPRRPRRLR
jgi:hypothetical protein